MAGVIPRVPGQFSLFMPAAQPVDLIPAIFTSSSRSELK